MTRKSSVATTVLSLMLFIFGSTAKAQEFRVEGAGLEADPTSYSGPCPGLIKFKGKIQASAAGRVKYTYSHSDGGTGPEGYVDFEGPGVKYVKTTWQLGDASVLPHFEGWAMLKILSPNTYESNKAKFVLDCKQGGEPQPQPNPNNKESGKEQSGNQDLQREIEKQRAERQRKLDKEAEILKAFSERLRPGLEEAARKIGFDFKVAEDEARAISQEKDADKQRQSAEEYSRKYEPQYKKLIQASGINVAEERRQLIAALGLNAAKVKPSDTLALEIRGDAEEGPVEAPPEEDVRRANEFGAYFLRVSFPQDQRTFITPPLTRPVTWGDGGSLYDPSMGRMIAQTSLIMFVGHSDAGTMLFGRFNLNFGVRRLRVIAEVDVNTILSAHSVFGYSSAEVFTGLNVECGSVTIGHHSISLGRVIAPVFGDPSLNERGVRTFSFEFNPEIVPSRQCLVGVSAASTAGAGGLFTSAFADEAVTLRRLTILGWYR